MRGAHGTVVRELGQRQQFRRPDDIADRAPQAVVAGGDDEPVIARSIGLYGALRGCADPSLRGLRPVPKYSLVCSAAIAAWSRTSGCRCGRRRRRHARGRAAPRSNTPRTARGEVRDRHAAFHRRAVGLAGHAHDAGRGLDRQGRSRHSPERGPVWPNAEIEQYTSDGLRSANHSLPRPRRFITPGRLFSISTSASSARRAPDRDSPRSSGLSATDCLPRLSEAKFSEKPSVIGGHWRRPVAFERFDLDHLGTEVGKQHAAERAGGNLAELDDAHASSGRGARLEDAGGWRWCGSWRQGKMMANRLICWYGVPDQFRPAPRRLAPRRHGDGKPPSGPDEARASAALRPRSARTPAGSGCGSGSRSAARSRSGCRRSG